MNTTTTQHTVKITPLQIHKLRKDVGKGGRSRYMAVLIKEYGQPKDAMINLKTGRFV